MADWQQVVYDLLNGAIFKYPEQPQPRFQGHAIIQRWMTQKQYKIDMVQQTRKRYWYVAYSTLPSSMTLSDL